MTPPPMRTGEFRGICVKVSASLRIPWRHATLRINWRIWPLGPCLSLRL